jgi:anti-sigma factor RsiW
MDDRIEAFLDGTLPADEHAAFERHLYDVEDEWEMDLMLARQIRDGLHTLPEPVCPPHVTDAVLGYARQHAGPSWLAQFHMWMATQWTMLWQPALAMAVLLILVVSASLVGKPEQPGPPIAAVNEAEVQRALAEVEWTLAYLSDLGRQTGQTVRHDVIEERVVVPVQDALGTLNERPRDHQQ